MFSTKVDKKIEDNQVIDGTELYKNLNFNHKLTETDFDNISDRFALEEQIQEQEIKILFGFLIKLIL